MKKATVIMTIRVLGTSPNDKAEKDQPPFLVAFEGTNVRTIPGSDEIFEERTVERFKSAVEVPKGVQTLRVEIGAYVVSGTQTALYGRILEILPGATTATTPAKRPAEGGKP
ncbi:MAG: hypothetical protein NTZ90_10785 [Proteobacteria bacterium]|nr:hypothetical protein [Pseudomonadota bacterium]